MRGLYSNEMLVLQAFLAGMICCAPIVYAQEIAEDPAGSEQGSGDTAQPATERRVRRLGDMASDEYELDLTVPGAPPGIESSTAEPDLPDPEQNARLQQILSTLATNPGNAEALLELDALLSEVLAAAHALADEGRLADAEHLLFVVNNVNSRKPGLADAYLRLENMRIIPGWLAAANAALARDALIEPPENCAWFFFGEVIRVDPNNADARQGLLKVQQGVIARALSAAQDFDFELANEWLEEAARVREPQDLVVEARKQIEGFQVTQAEQIEQAVLDAIVARNFDYAEFVLIDLIALGGNEARVASLRERLKEARRYGEFAPGEVIYDFFPDKNVSAPPVVVIAAGSFLMGSPEDEEGRLDNEGPQHRVTITRGFALGVLEVTVEQFRLFIESSGYHTQAELNGSSNVYDEKSGRLMNRDDVNWRHDYEGRRARDNMPVLHVDWYDAQAYTKWLSEQTGKHYRLPTEAEYEYALRAGSVTAYWWGNGHPGELVENLTGDGDVSATGRNWSTGFEDYSDRHWGPAPVGSFSANAFGLHDMGGNVSEWIMDCWHEVYTRAPVDGSAWVNPGCDRRVVRGGYWASSPARTRSAARLSGGARLHGSRVGFRVARDL